MLGKLIYPAFVFVAVGIHWLLMVRYPAINPIFLVSPSLVVGLFFVAAAERILPFRSEWNRADSDLWSDFVLTNLVFPVIVLGIIFGLRFSCGEKGIWALWPKSLPLAVQLVGALAIAEFFFYWGHRISHEWAGLWRFHRVHHSSKRVYWMNSARFHPVDLTLNFVLYFLPLSLFGTPFEIYALLFTLNSATGLMEHANVDFDAGFLNHIFNTAQLHRWHHSVIVDESMKNYGKVLSIWDQVFGTYFRPRERSVGIVGISEQS